MPHRLLLMALFLVFVLPTVETSQPIQSSLAWAAEQKCADLDSQYGAGTCVCSEPFNTNTLVVTQTFWKNPADSTTKECSTAGIAGGALESNDVNKIVGRNDSTMLGALPAGHKLQWAVGGVNNHLGIFFAGHTFNSSNFLARLAVRFYLYHSTDFQFAGEGVCTNSKLLQFTGPNSLIDKSFGYIHMYNFTDWSPAQDCCFHGPGPDENAIQSSNWRGNWWRLEFVEVNRAGPNWAAYLYAKNVTTNGPEYTIVDTTATGTQLNNPVNRTPPQRQDGMAINMYRETGCNGWEAFSHYIMAGWNTNSGQRIGGAFEVEGTGTPPPLAPFNVRLTIFLLSVLGGSGGFGLYLWRITRRHVHAQPPESGTLSLGGPRPEPPRPVAVGRPAEDHELVGASTDRANR